jgi:hypothetical protein
MDDLRLTKKSDDQLIGACPFKRNMVLEIIDFPFLEWKFMLKAQHNLANRHVCKHLSPGLYKALIHASLFGIKQPNRSTSLSLSTHPSKYQTTNAPSLPHPIHQPSNPPTD